MKINKRNKERGAALIETAITIPIVLLISVAIFEFGRAYQTWQVLTNAAREGARIAILTGKTDDEVRAAVTRYLNVGGLPTTNVTVNMNRNVDLGASNASQITVLYPYSFMVLNPVVQLIASGATTGEPITMSAQALMRNEN